MSKILTCEICRDEVPTREDANVCGSNCRVKRWRKIKNEEKMKNAERFVKNAEKLGHTFTMEGACVKVEPCLKGNMLLEFTSIAKDVKKYIKERSKG